MDKKDNISKIATINLPEEYVAAIDSLVTAEVSPSRSELMRTILGSFLIKEKRKAKHISDFVAEKIKIEPGIIANALINKKLVAVNLK